MPIRMIDFASIEPPGTDICVNLLSSRFQDDGVHFAASDLQLPSLLLRGCSLKSGDSGPASPPLLPGNHPISPEQAKGKAASSRLAHRGAETLVNFMPGRGASDIATPARPAEAL